MEGCSAALAMMNAEVIIRPMLLAMVAKPRNAASKIRSQKPETRERSRRKVVKEDMLKGKDRRIMSND
jgi:hypothetical protein